MTTATASLVVLIYGTLPTRSYFAIAMERAPADHIGKKNPQALYGLLTKSLRERGPSDFVLDMLESLGFTWSDGRARLALLDAAYQEAVDGVQAALDADARAESAALVDDFLNTSRTLAQAAAEFPATPFPCRRCAEFSSEPRPSVCRECRTGERGAA